MTGGIAETSVWGGWSLDKAAALELAAAYRRDRPTLVVEAGSGLSTVVAGEYARDTGATVVALEHDATYADRTRRMLVDRGLDQYVDLRHAPLKDIDTATGSAPWYGTRLPDGIEFALIDGPPGTIGRRGAMYGLMPHLAGDWQVWLDDAGREAESAALVEWETLIGGIRTRSVPLPKGLAVITPAASVVSTPATTTVITVLTGMRPRHLTETALAFDAAAPGVLTSAYVIVCHNGDDKPTAEVIDEMPWVNERMSVGGSSMISLGRAMSAISARVDQLSLSMEYWLHLEDDWVAATAANHGWWMGEAKRVLDNHPDIGQVRLRHRSQPTHQRNIRTGVPITWEPLDEHSLVSGTAHYTCNPSLMRTTDTCLAWPASGEPGAIDRYARSGRRVAQLSPGVFHHTGGDKSLEGHPAPGRTRALGGRRHHVNTRRGKTDSTPPRTTGDYTRFYEDGGWTYDTSVESGVMRMIAHLARWMPGDRVHEIGSGRGDHAGILEALGYRVTAVEIATSGTEATVARFPMVSAVNADVSTWTPEEKGHIFARGMSWFHWELSGTNSYGVDVPEQTRALVNRALDPRGSFVLQIWSDLSGHRPKTKIHCNTVADYHGLFDPIFTNVNIYDWSGNPITPGRRHDRGVIVVANGPR